MAFVELENVEKRMMLPGCVARFVHGDNVTLSYWDL